ncbi:putative cupredoxin-like copper-binding protein [Rhizobium tibeticum]|nr:putative cupredoxin-like copper-binding protein [Rhizobium tibeticum]
MKIYALALALAAIASPALASGNHAGGHGEKMAVGEPGDKSKVTQTIRVTMRETEDGKMLFQPAVIKVRKDQTVKSPSRTRAKATTSSCSIRKTKSWSTRR